MWDQARERPCDEARIGGPMSADGWQWGRSQQKRFGGEGWWRLWGRQRFPHRYQSARKGREGTRTMCTKAHATALAHAPSNTCARSLNIGAVSIAHYSDNLSQVNKSTINTYSAVKLRRQTFLLNPVQGLKQSNPNLAHQCGVDSAKLGASLRQESFSVSIEVKRFHGSGTSSLSCLEIFPPMLQRFHGNGAMRCSATKEKRFRLVPDLGFAPAC